VKECELARNREAKGRPENNIAGAEGDEFDTRADLGVSLEKIEWITNSSN
jgi:hypothetical protein